MVMHNEDDESDSSHSSDESTFYTNNTNSYTDISSSEDDDQNKNKIIQKSVEDDDDEQEDQYDDEFNGDTTTTTTNNNNNNNKSKKQEMKKIFLSHTHHWNSTTFSNLEGLKLRNQSKIRNQKIIKQEKEKLIEKNKLHRCQICPKPIPYEDELYDPIKRAKLRVKLYYKMKEDEKEYNEVKRKKESKKWYQKKNSNRDNIDSIEAEKMIKLRSTLYIQRKRASEEDKLLKKLKRNLKLNDVFKVAENARYKSICGKTECKIKGSYIMSDYVHKLKANDISIGFKQHK